MTVRIVRAAVSAAELRSMAEAQFGDMVKAVVRTRGVEDEARRRAIREILVALVGR